MLKVSETGRFRRLQRTKHSYDLDEMPSMDGLPPTGFHQGTVHGLIRHQSLDDDAVLKNRLEKKDGLYGEYLKEVDATASGAT